MTIQLPGDRHSRRHSFQPLNRLNFWLATVESGQVGDVATEAKVIEYQTQCADVLFQHFFGHANTDQLEPKVAELTRRVEELAAGMRVLTHGFDPTQAVVRDYLPSKQILINLGVPQKGREPLSVSCSKRLNKFCIATRQLDAIRISHETERYLFRVDVIDAWLRISPLLCEPALQ